MRTYVSLQVPKAVNAQITAFWVVTPCIIVSGYQHLGETVVEIGIHYITRRHYSEDSSELEMKIYPAAHFV
jgi:hypothetical protein